jgi:uncharacterized membrane protein YdjX (TVP38/TMEM64 family)
MATSNMTYGMPPQAYPPTTTSSYSEPGRYSKTPDDARRVSRTPSPTPSEEAELSRDNLLDWKNVTKWRFWFRREWLWYYIIGAIVAIITILVTIFHTQIVHALTPVTNWMHGLKFGWLIPIGVLFVISFPPLFGHEIVAILCGLVWGLWIGFGIVAAGTYLGEIGNFYAFKYCCRARGEKLEKEKIPYACLAKVVRDGGFKIALIARLSVMPGHFTTAIFATCGMSVITFSIAAILSMPKQFITVYLGVILEQSGTGTQSSKNRLISDVVLGITILVTGAAMWYLMRKMKQVKPEVIHARRKARQAKFERAGFMPYGSSNDSTVFNPYGSDTNIPLNPSTDSPYSAGAPYQQWDKEGRAIGYASDPSLLAPKPRHVIPTYRNDKDVGTSYPQGGSETAGRSAVRQESGDSIGWVNQHEGASETYQLPRITGSPQRLASPLGAHESPYNAAPSATNQLSYPPPFGPPSSTSPIAPLPQTQYANYHPPVATEHVISPPLPNPHVDATPKQFNHPQVPFSEYTPEATNATFYAAESNSQIRTQTALQGAFTPSPPSHQTNTPR